MTFKFNVPEISCDHCKSTIINTLSSVDNIELVEVNIETKDVTLNSSEDIDLDLCLLYTSPSPRDCLLSRMPSSA